ncbi:MAG: DUF177 domain-containing protein [Candidatus Krumholzibacteria bacterium]|nr:DUF177 domain-containing protein [Candidatus Krumholzibacteria bacterium]MDH5268918.1 DUF177 domain-containing protein [Candidatus Krumholzibacteria bacterium]
MIIDLRELVHLRGDIEGDVVTRVDDPVAGELIVPCHVTVDYRQSQGTFYLHGSVDADVGTVCHRCLEPVTSRVSGVFDVIVRRGVAEGGGGDDMIILASHEHEVPLEPLVHEAVVVSVPMVVACRDDCKGLCPGCGTNLNAGSCTCKDKGDSRWDALRDVKLD